jgi:type II secretory pathway predicted ATPase ExeA
VFFHLEEIKLGGCAYLTELTWMCGSVGREITSHYPVRHPGSRELDDSITSIQPDYVPAHRYSDLVIGTALLVDFDAQPKGTMILGTSEKQAQALKAYLMSVPRQDLRFIKMIRSMHDIYVQAEVDAMQARLGEIRQEAMRSRG